MIRSSFRLAPGVGPFLESRLWDDGISTWDDFPAAPRVALQELMTRSLKDETA